MEDITLKKCDTRIIYEKVSLRTPLHERHYFNYLDDTCLELLALHPGKVKVNEDEEYKAAKRLSDYINIKGIFIPAIVDNILYLAGVGDVFKTEFVRKAEEAASAGKRKYGIIKGGLW